MQGPTGTQGPQGPTGLLGESLAQSITLLTGGRLKTNDEDARFDADGLWLKSAGDETYRPEASLKFYTGSWTNKLTLGYLRAYNIGSTNTQVIELVAPATSGLGASITSEAFADTYRTAYAKLGAQNENAGTEANVMLRAGPTGSAAQIFADRLTTNAAMDILKPKHSTGNPATGGARFFVRSTGASNAKEQFVVVFKTGAVQVIATEP